MLSHFFAPRIRILSRRLSSAKTIPNDFFPYDRDFKSMMLRKSFHVDKTNFIRLLETRGEHYKLCRPRRFGKSTLCDMLTFYYDKSTSDKEVWISLVVDTFLKMFSFFSSILCLERRRLGRTQHLCKDHFWFSIFPSVQLMSTRTLTPNLTITSMSPLRIFR